METNILKFGVTLTMVALLFSSCNDFLDTEQRGVTSQNDFYKTDEEAEQALFAIYDRLQSNDLNTFEWKNILSDDAQAGGGSRTDNGQGNPLNEFTFESANTILSGMYTKFYQMIYRANLVIKNVSDDTDTKKVCIAEAKALRAYAYIELVTMWGGVPLVTEPLTAGNYNQPNSTVEAIWAQIETDLTEAIDILPLKSAQNNYARFSKGAAQAYLGKAYLFQKKYEQAAAIFQTIIDSKEYSLYPIYGDLTKEVSEFGCESLFEISYSADISYVLEATRIAAYCGPRAPWFTPGSSGLSNSGWGFVNPLPGLFNAYVEAGDKVRMMGNVIDETTLQNEYNGSMRATDNSIPYGSDGLVRMKYGAFLSEIAEEKEDYHTIAGTNFREMRYADVLLMAAEAYNRQGAPNDSKAQEYVNLVRARVDLDPISSTGDELFSAIKLERRLELAFEGHRFQDLIRWGDAATVLAEQGKKTSLGTFTDGVENFFINNDAGFKVGKNELLPYPEGEISVNPNIKQNPGY